MGRIKETEKLKKEGKEKVKRVGIKRIVKLKKERNLKVKKVGMERAVEQEKERKVKVAKIRKIEQGRVKAKAKKREKEIKERRRERKKERAKKMVGAVLKWLRVYTTSFGVLIFLLSKFLSNVWRTKSKTNFSTIVIGDKICILSTKTIQLLVI